MKRLKIANAAGLTGAGNVPRPEVWRRVDQDQREGSTELRTGAFRYTGTDTRRMKEGEELSYTVFEKRPATTFINLSN